MQPDGAPPHCRAINDSRGRVVVAINYNLDIGDAWEHADMSEYPEAATSLAYRFGINYIVFSMAHQLSNDRAGCLVRSFCNAGLVQLHLSAIE